MKQIIRSEKGEQSNEEMVNRVVRGTGDRTCDVIEKSRNVGGMTDGSMITRFQSNRREECGSKVITVYFGHTLSPSLRRAVSTLLETAV